jgi:hypothetical protein
MTNRKATLITALILIVSLGLLSLLKVFKHSEKTPQERLAELSTPHTSFGATPKTLPNPAQVSAFLASPKAASPIVDKPSHKPSKESLKTLRREFSQSHQAPARNLAQRDREIWLLSRTLTIPAGRNFPDSLAETNQTPRQTTPCLVHFDQRITDELRESLENAGAHIKNYLPNNSFLVELDDAALTALKTIEAIDFVTPTQAEDRIQPFLKSLIQALDADTTLSVNIQTLAPQDSDPVAALVTEAGGTVQQINHRAESSLILANIPLSAIEPLAENASIQWIEEDVPAELSNDKAQIPEHLNTQALREDWGLTGRGQIIAHGDDGLSTGDQATLHPDFRGQILAMINVGKDDVADIWGHGTHTAGSIVGTGLASKGQFKGSAPEAMLVHQGLGNNDGGLSIPDYYELLAVPYNNYGARIRSDSWGSKSYGVYNTDCQTADSFAWEHPDHLSVMSAGNSGIDTNADGVIDSDSVGSPASAKNILAIGAAENDREPAVEGFRNYQFGSGSWAYYFPAEPISSDYISYSATTEPYQQGIAAFSSRGPTDDGRIKPEVVAPGTDVISTACSIALGYNWGGYPANDAYCYEGGTSMSCPLTAGTVALIRQYMVEQAGIPDPSAALMKATLIGGSRSLAPGQYGEHTFQEIPYSSPNNVEGWGQPDLLNAIHPQGAMIQLLDDIQPATHKSKKYDISIIKPGQSLDIVLSWTDYPAAVEAAVTLVNDLDLSLITPSGKRLYPNDLNEPDRLNTIESIRVDSAETGNYQIVVSGYNVPYPRGVAALYIRGAFDAPEIIVHEAKDFIGCSSNGSVPIDFKVQSLNPLNKGQLHLYWSFEGSDWQSTEVSWLGGAAYRAELPVNGQMGTIEYFIVCENANRSTRLPASEELFSTQVSTPVTLTISGTPNTTDYAFPYFGSHTYFVGETIKAEAFDFRSRWAETKYSCSGWTGTGSVPESGTSSIVEFTINEDSSLYWNLNASQYQFTLEWYMETLSRVLRQPERKFYDPGTELPAFDAPDSVVDFYTYMELSFAGWTVNGVRWPDETSSSPNRIEGIIFNQTTLLRAIYIDSSLDSDGNGITDAYEKRYFGNVDHEILANDDPDNDGWTNQEEYLDNTDPTDAASYPQPPHISVDEHNSPQTNHTPWTLSATITDSFIVKDAELIWWETGSDETHRESMTDTGANTFTAQIDPPSHGSLTVEYMIRANDLLSLSEVYAPAISPVYTIVANYESPWLDASLETHVFHLDDAAVETSLSLSHLAGDDVSWSASVLVETTKIPSSDADWTHSGVNDYWRTTTYRNWDGNPVWYCGNQNTNQYSNNGEASLDTPAISVSTQTVLSFRHWLKAEHYNDDIYVDGAILQISTDGGSSFEDILPIEGYPHRIYKPIGSSFSSDQPCFGSTDEAWQTVYLDLAAYAGQEVILRFLFASNGDVNDEGWYIADLAYMESTEELPTWLTIDGPLSGILSEGSRELINLTIDPEMIALGDQDNVLLRIEPELGDVLFQALSVDRGYHLTTTIHGGGSVSPASARLLKNQNTPCQIVAGNGNYIDQVFVNGVERSGYGDISDTKSSVFFINSNTDQNLEVFFGSRVWTLDIESEEDISTPEVGSYNERNGAEISVSVKSMKVDIDPFTQRVCTGWTLLKGSQKTVCHSDIATFTMDDNATLTWHWQTNYLINTTTEGKGSVDPKYIWKKAGSIASTTATPATCFAFDDWLGDTEDSTRFGNKLVFPVNSPRTLLAYFKQFATENYQIPYSWLSQYGITQNLEQAVEENPDNDPSLTFEEYIAGTHPIDGNSYLSIESINRDDDSTQLQWNAIQGRRYTLFSSSDLINFEAIDTVTAPTNSIRIPRTDNDPQMHYFYIKAELDD